MGTNCSKSTSKTNNDDGTPLEPDDGTTIVRNDYDKQMVEYLEKQLKSNVEAFILNQLLMTLMFYTNFDSEITQTAASTTLENDVLIKNQKELILPDVVFKTVRESLGRPLTRERMYIIHNNIEVEDKTSNSEDYENIDDIVYQTQLKNSKMHNGFVHVEILKVHKKNSSDNKQEDVYNNELFEPPTSTDMKDDSGFKTDSEPNYSTLIESQTPRQVDSVDADKYTFSSELPPKCITAVITSDTDERAWWKTDYLNSHQFMEHFKNNVFPNYLGPCLGFGEENIRRMKSIDGSVFCKYDKTRDYEIIPSLEISWPSFSSKEWSGRPRNKVLNNEVTYIWPTPNMCKEAINLKCVVTSKGFVPKKKKNTNREIEWEIEFPKVEKYLELTMTHAQMRIYILLIILYHRFLKKKSRKVGFTIAHIRHFMFWECEDNYVWPEHNLGVKLKQILKKLTEHLGTYSLSHYFIRNKNMFENFPCKHTLELLDEFAKINDDLIKALIIALQDLEYTKPSQLYLPHLDKLNTILYGNEIKNMGRKENYVRQKEVKKKVEHFNWSTMKKRFENEGLCIELVEFFIKQFIEIAERSLLLSSADEGLMYLKQATYLTKLIPQEYSESAITFQEKISKLEESCDRKKGDESKPPQTPRRNTFNTINYTFQKNNTQINAANLSRTNNRHISLKNESNKQQTTTKVIRNLPQSNLLAEEQPSTSSPQRKKKTISFSPELDDNKEEESSFL